ncbi:30S ribosomal protein S3 [PVC group bacterium (ex Bugula neritina AB1)]|nr:30S ribosomal protein S3 [PVC group bacterium (ex Bugula neritina AB1)]
MGQKTHPVGFRLGIFKTWQSRWFAQKKEYAKYLHQDLNLRQFIKKRLSFAGISSVKFERAGEKLTVKINASRPGVVIGRKGVEVDNLKVQIEKMTKCRVVIDINEVRNPEKDAQLVAESIALQFEKRASFRRVMKKAISSALAAGVEGIKLEVSGRLGGAEMARREGYKEGKIPLHTLRADIDYGFAQAYTTYGVIGVKVWIYKGEILRSSPLEGKDNRSK